jgi:hypothetical protein
MPTSRVPGEDDEPFPDDLDLSHLDDAFGRARVAARERIPDGTYEAQVELVELGRAPRSGDPMLSWTLTLLSPSAHGRRLWRHLVLAPTNLAWLKRDLEICGLRLDKLSDLPRHLDALHGVRLKIAKRARGAYHNVYFLRRLPD